MDTSVYQVSDLDVDDFYQNDQLDENGVFRLGIVTPFSPTSFDVLEPGDSIGNPILLDKKEDKENSPPTTPVSETLTRPPALLKSRPFGATIEIIPEKVYRILFQQVSLCMCFNLDYI